MTAQDYIIQKLEELKQPTAAKEMSDKEELKDEIFRLLMSKKFRKYSTNLEYQEQIKKAISINVDKNQPIRIVFPFGGYKLWRLEETPEIDWAELFTTIYYAEWLKPICNIYKSGVNLEFYSDDFIVPRLNNIDPKDTKAYRESFYSLIEFLEKYLPNNLKIEFNRVIDKYKNEAEFEADLTSKMAITEAGLDGKLPTLTDKDRAMIDLNVKLTKEQASDKNWREKVKILHDSYLAVDKRRPYYRQPNMILMFSSPITNCIAVGTTKRSVAKFWCGVGVLEKENNDFHMLVLSPKQVESNTFEYETVNISALVGKNFHKIRIKKH